MTHDSTSTPHLAETPSGTCWRAWFVWLAVALVALLAHYPILENGFISFDDAPYVYDNPQVQKGLTFETFIWAFSSVVVANWHPITMLSHLLDATLYGTKDAWGHHLTALILHAANAALLGYVLSRYTGSIYRSAAVALIFAVHPIHVESVAWVASRKDGLSFFFAMLTLLAYLRWTQRKTVGRYALLIVGFFMALMSKPTTVTLPALLLLLDFWPLNRTGCGAEDGFGRAVRKYLASMPGLIKEKVPLLAAMFVGAFMVFIIQRSAEAMVSAQGLSIAARVSNALFAYVRYMGKLFFPYDLTLMYPHPTWWPASYIVGSLVLLILLTAGIVWAGFRTGKRYLIVGWLWFLGTMLPMIGIIQVGAQSMADRYAYFTFPGLYILIVWAAADVLGRVGAPRQVGAAVAGLIVLALIPVTHRQAAFWVNTETLMHRALAVTHDNGVANFLMANELLIRQHRYEESLPYFRETLRIEPKYADAHGNMGTALLSLNRLEEAKAAYEKSIQMSEGKLIEPRINLGVIYTKQGDVATAEMIYKKLIVDQPLVAESYFYLAQIRIKQERLDEAFSLLNQALEKDPQYAVAFNSRGILNARAGNIQAAHDDFARALAIKPDLTDARENLQKAADMLKRKPSTP